MRQTNSKRYPTLARIALDVLPVQASSVACERLFSAAKHITTDNRSRLRTDVFEQLQLLKTSWRPHLVDIAKENQMLEEEVRIDEEMFNTLERMDAEDIDWMAEEDCIA